MTGRRTRMLPVAKPKRSAPLTAFARTLKIESESAQLDLHFGLAVRTHDDRRIEIGHRREVLAHRDVVQQRLLLGERRVAARLLLERQRAERQVAGVAAASGGWRDRR